MTELELGDLGRLTAGDEVELIDADEDDERQPERRGPRPRRPVTVRP